MRFFSICVFIGLALVIVAQDRPATPLVDVELSVRGPDLQAVRNAGAVLRAEARQGLDPPTPDIHITTDENGVAHFKWPAGVFGLSLRAPGIGYGYIGRTEFVPGHIARPELPPLAGYLSVEGTVPQMCGHDVLVRLGERDAKADANGHFRINDIAHVFQFDVVHWLYASAGENPCTEPIAITNPKQGMILRNQILPPRIATGSVWGTNMIEPAAPKPKSSDLTFIRDTPATHEESVWLHGTVRDPGGHPIAGANVLALGVYYGGTRMYEQAAKAVSDAGGHYEIKGSAGLSFFSATVIASVPGHPPAWAWPAFPEPAAQDLIVPSVVQGGRAVIQVMSSGKPVPGATVALYLANANLKDEWAVGDSQGESLAPMEDAAYPNAVTNSDGIAAFEHLIPGRYRIQASTNGRTRSEPAGMADGVTVRAGETTTFKVNIYRQSYETSFRIRDANGAPYTASTASRGGPVDSVAWSSTEGLDASGAGHRQLGRTGLSRIDFMYRTAPISSYPIQPPFFLANGIMAVSPALAGSEPPVLTARWVDAPSLRVVVQDEAGKPVHASVSLRKAFGEIAAAGSTNDDGIVFKGLEAGEYTAHAGGTDLSRKDPFPPNSTMPFPTLEELRAEPALIDVKVKAVEGVEKTVVLRPVLWRYIYGSFRGNADPSSQWGLYLAGPDLQEAAQIHWRAKGEFVVGPFPPGPVRLDFREAGRPDSQVYHETVELRGERREPVRFDVDVSRYTPRPAEKPLATGAQAILGMGGISSRTTGVNHLAGKVFLPDGITPALGAQALYYEAGRTSPSIFAMADAEGNLQPSGVWQQSYSGADAHPADAPILVALLPGSYGATVQTSPIHPDQPFRLVLPRGNVLRGQVRIGRESPNGRAGSIEVIAAFRDRGVLNAALSVAATADADGRFTLAGLTDGSYVIQAALDQIWLSAPVRVEVKGGAIKALNLTIPPPGAPLRVHLVDGSGQPAKGKAITLDHAGPLAELWPHEWVSDGAGIVWVPTLESGTHTLQVSGSSQQVKVNVPPLPAGAIDVQIPLPRR